MKFNFKNFFGTSDADITMKSISNSTVTTSISGKASTIEVNGKRYSGKSVEMRGNKIFVDGKEVDGNTEQSKAIHIVINGDVEKIDGLVESLIVNGNATNVSTVSGDVRISGDVLKNVQTISGDVKCGDIKGNVNTVSGDVK